MCSSAATYSMRRRALLLPTHLPTLHIPGERDACLQQVQRHGKQQLVGRWQEALSSMHMRGHAAWRHSAVACLKHCKGTRLRCETAVAVVAGKHRR